MLFLVDANVLIYTRDFRDSTKQQAATGWIKALAEQNAAIVNLQVLNEVCEVALRKLRHLSQVEVRRWIADLAAFGDTYLDAEIVEAAWAIQSRYRFNWFDCLILGSADHLGCSHVLTEDMGAPRRVGPLTLVNPFSARPGDVLSAS